MKRNYQFPTTSRTIIMPNNEKWNWEDFTPEEQDAFFTKWGVRFVSKFGLIPKKSSEYIVNDAENILNKIDYQTRRNTELTKHT